MKTQNFLPTFFFYIGAVGAHIWFFVLANWRFYHEGNGRETTMGKALPEGRFELQIIGSPP